MQTSVSSEVFAGIAVAGLYQRLVAFLASPSYNLS